MKHVIIIGKENIDNTLCSPCYAEDVKSRVQADVLVEEMASLPSAGELLPTNRTVYGLCASHAAGESLVQ